MKALYSLYDALVSINVPTDKARAVVDAMEHDMTTLLTTKSDLQATQLLLKRDLDASHALLKQEIGAVRDSTSREFVLIRQEMAAQADSLRKEIKLAARSTALLLTSIQVGSLGLIIAAIKAFA